MIEKLPALDFRQGMQIWQEQRRQEVAQENNHLSGAELEHYAAAGGLASAGEAVLEHLAFCPICLEKWAEACRKDEALPPVAVADDWYGGGMMEAAATEQADRPVFLPSICGDFILRLFPEGGESLRGMVALEAIGAEAKTRAEGARVTVRDNRGEVLLSGTFVGGRVARMVEALSRYDLQSWSLIVRTAGAK
jgi:hypothetical protein